MQIVYSHCQKIQQGRESASPAFFKTRRSQIQEQASFHTNTLRIAAMLHRARIDAADVIPLLKKYTCLDAATLPAHT